MSQFTLPHDAITLIDALRRGLSEHVHDELTDRSTFDLSDFLVLLGDRDRATESKLSGLPLDVPWGFGDPAAVGTTTIWVPPRRTLVGGFSMGARVAGSTASSANLLHNGVTIASLTLAAGQLYSFTPIVPPVVFAGRSDAMAVQATAVGTGVAGLGGGIEVVG